PILIGVAVVVASAWVLAAAGARAQDAAAPSLSDNTLLAILTCLARGQEIVMSTKPDCKPYGEGYKTAEKDKMPLGARDGTWDQVCQSKDDPRRLPRDVIKRIATQKDAMVAPSGIRIIGAVFCGGVDLVGLDVPYSIVIDRSVIDGDIDARNLRVRGDFSFE